MNKFLQFFQSDHLPPEYRMIGELFGQMAEESAEKLPQNSESTMCMRKLLEARDCAMRSAFFG